MIESLGWVRGAFMWGWCCWGRFCRVGSWKTTLGCHFVAVLVSMEMAPKGLYKISIPSKPIKIVHAISLQNDSPPTLFFSRTFTIFHQEPLLQNENPLNVSISVTFSPFGFWAGEKKPKAFCRETLGMWGHWNYKMTNLGGAQTNTPTKWQTCGVCEQPPLCHIYTFRIHCMVCFGPHFNQFLQAFSWPYFIILYFWVLLNTSSGFWWSTKCLHPAPPP